MQNNGQKRFTRSFYRPVAQYSLEGDYIASYRSAAFAGREVTKGKKGGTVYACASGKVPTAYGYRWTFITPVQYREGITPENLEPLPKKKKKRKSKKEKEKEKLKRIPALDGESFVPLPLIGLRKFFAISNLGRIYNTSYKNFVPVQEDGNVWLHSSCYNVSKLMKLAYNEQ